MLEPVIETIDPVLAEPVLAEPVLKKEVKQVVAEVKAAPEKQDEGAKESAKEKVIGIHDLVGARQVGYADDRLGYADGYGYGGYGIDAGYGGYGHDAGYAGYGLDPGYAGYARGGHLNGVGYGLDSGVYYDRDFEGVIDGGYGRVKGTPRYEDFIW